jgi:hypothetical protein
MKMPSASPSATARKMRPRSCLSASGPGGRLLILSEHAHAGLPIMITEFGGIAYAEDEENTWGYSRCRTAEEFANRYCELLGVIRQLPMVAGFCYTQFADTYQEANGLLFSDRRPKFPLKDMTLATRGPKNVKEQHLEAAWRERIMRYNRGQHVQPEDEHQMQHETR